MQAENTDKTPAAFACPQCSATFGRLEHLQRHATSTHSIEKPYPCTFCNQSFARRDVLLRHLKSCKAKPATDGTPPQISIPPRRRGRKRKSCDACARLKRSCSGTHPCLTCVHRKQICSFPGAESSRTEGERPKTGSSEDLDGSSSGEDWENNLLAPLSEANVVTGESYLDHDATVGALANENPSTVQFAHPLPMPYYDSSGPPNGLGTVFGALSAGACSMSFLENFTNTKGMANSFDCGTIEQRTLIMQAILADPSSLELRNRDDNRTVMKTHLIVSALKEAAENLRKRNVKCESWSDSLEMGCYTFFAPDNLRRFLICYWAFWHPNCPIIHKPLFSMENAPPSLVAVMALIGACLSPYATDRDSALGWLDFVEEWVFSSRSFSDDPLPCDPTDVTNLGLQDRLDALRAAYCAILLQTWEGSEDAKRRARRSRYTDIIGAFRSVCSTSIIHKPLQTYFNNPTLSWKEFAVKEELIRTLTYIVLLDSAYVIFNNTPPRMALQEARLQLACPEACFQAEDVSRWTDAMHFWAATDLGNRRVTICQLISLIWNSQINERDWAMLQQMSTLDMFIIVHPLHVQLFHVRCHPMPGTQTMLLRQALDNWKLIHAQRTGIPGLPEIPPLDPCDWWTRNGFPQYAFEYWSLADFILGTCEAIPMASPDQSGNTSEHFVSQVLNRYDESDMRQVHDLVTLFSSMNLAL